MPAPFRFESKRIRIDWRVLHGVDINALVSAGARALCVLRPCEQCSAGSCWQRVAHCVCCDNPAQVRDVDLDILERVVGVVAFGDLEAEDTSQLSEASFLKVFRLSQLVVEYLLYVQDCLQATNGWLQSER
jgi:zinc finger protein DZIP1